RFGLTEDMPPEVARERVTAEVARVLGDRKVGDVCYFLGQLVGLSFPESPLTEAATEDAGQVRALRRVLVRRFLNADAEQEPVVLVFDDLHFADGDSLDLLGALIEQLRGPILIVCAAGRELLSSGDDWAALGGN